CRMSGPRMRPARRPLTVRIKDSTMLRVNTWLAAGALLALTVTAYFPLWHNDFVNFDDDHYITDNPHVAAGMTPHEIAWAWTTLHGAYWQPLAWLSLQADAQLFSAESPAGGPILSPAAFHGDNLFWHAASTLLLFRFWSRLSGSRGQGFLVAALFGVHP